MTSDPDTEGTRICDQVDQTPAVMAVVHRSGVTVITLTTLQMWQEAGFLQKAFTPFKDLGMSIDLVATSQSTVSITLDHIPGGVSGKAFAELTAMLEEMAGPYGKLEIQHNMSTVSIVGRHLRRLLSKIGLSFAVLPSDPLGESLFLTLTLLQRCKELESTHRVCIVASAISQVRLALSLTSFPTKN